MRPFGRTAAASSTALAQGLVRLRQRWYRYCLQGIGRRGVSLRLILFNFVQLDKFAPAPLLTFKSYCVCKRSLDVLMTLSASPIASFTNP